MTTLRAHFDGKVFIPDEPVDLPKGTALELDIREVSEAGEPKYPRAWLEIDESGMPVIKAPPGTKKITLEDVKRAEDEP